MAGCLRFINDVRKQRRQQWMTAGYGKIQQFALMFFGYLCWHKCEMTASGGITYHGIFWSAFWLPRLSVYRYSPLETTKEVLSKNAYYGFETTTTRDYLSIRYKYWASRKLNKKAPIALGQIIESVNSVYRSEDGYQTEANAFANCCRSEDFKEGTSAFLEKRKPIFKGK